MSRRNSFSSRCSQHLRSTASDSDKPRDLLLGMAVSPLKRVRTETGEMTPMRGWQMDDNSDSPAMALQSFVGGLKDTAFCCPKVPSAAPTRRPTPLEANAVPQPIPSQSRRAEELRNPTGEMLLLSESPLKKPRTIPPISFSDEGTSEAMDITPRSNVANQAANQARIRGRHYHPKKHELVGKLPIFDSTAGIPDHAGLAPLAAELVGQSKCSSGAPSRAADRPELDTESSAQQQARPRLRRRSLLEQQLSEIVTGSCLLAAKASAIEIRLQENEVFTRASRVTESLATMENQAKAAIRAGIKKVVNVARLAAITKGYPSKEPFKPTAPRMGPQMVTPRLVTPRLAMIGMSPAVMSSQAGCMGNMGGEAA